ncbi:MAG: hypothetical protein JWO46_597, partial [Nocardioidaceae bacterium]|nr:hypothetical protein [Nocardioidaceae bacterium]
MPGATLDVITVPGPTDDQTLLAQEMAYVENERGFEQVQFGQPEELTPPSSAVVSASRVLFQCVVASQQQGTIPLLGLTVVMTRQDGSGVVATTVFNQDMLTDGDNSPVVQDINPMLNGIVSSIA